MTNILTEKRHYEMCVLFLVENWSSHKVYDFLFTFLLKTYQNDKNKEKNFSKKRNTVKTSQFSLFSRFFYQQFDFIFFGIWYIATANSNIMATSKSFHVKSQEQRNKKENLVIYSGISSERWIWNRYDMWLLRR